MALVAVVGVVGTFGLALSQRRTVVGEPLVGRSGPPAFAPPNERPSTVHPSIGTVHATTGRVRLDVAVMLCVVAVVNVVVVVQHWAGGGGLHPRYALLLVPLLGAFVGTVTIRWVGGAGALVLVAGALAVSSRQVLLATRWVNDHKTAPLESPLTMSIGPQWWRLTGVVLVAVGFVLVAASLVGGRVEAAWRTRGGEG